jgi:hypothetical protein
VLGEGLDIREWTAREVLVKVFCTGTAEVGEQIFEVGLYEGTECDAVRQKRSVLAEDGS